MALALAVARLAAGEASSVLLLGDAPPRAAHPARRSQPHDRLQGGRVDRGARLRLPGASSRSVELPVPAPPAEERAALLFRPARTRRRSRAAERNRKHRDALPSVVPDRSPALRARHARSQSPCRRAREARRQSARHPPER
jgi:hypothetical protein